MRERFGPLPRRIRTRSGVRATLLGCALVGVLLSGCGDRQAPDTSPSPSPTGCTPTMVPTGVELPVDLDGDGSAETVRYARASAGECPQASAELTASGGVAGTVSVDPALPVTGRDLAAVRLPGRTGDLVLLEQHHPRGGFQAHLYGYADGKLAELEAEGSPVFDFIATDVLTAPTAATCAAGGFVVTQARAHRPVGVMPAWDVFRTGYTVDGNTVAKGVTTEIADNVRDAELQRQFGALVDHEFFEECRVRP